MTTLCPLCGLRYEPGGGACRERACPLASLGCRALDCPRCGYAVPDERASVLARWIRRLFRTPAAVAGGPTLADLHTGEQGVVEGVEGDPALIARLTAQGLTKGVRLILVQRAPSFVVEMGETTLAFERRVARQVRMR